MASGSVGDRIDLMTRHARRRLCLSLTLIASLLFQQVAVAAFACAKQATPPPAAEAMADCTEMAMAPAQAQSPALCEKHCNPDHLVAPDASTASVPALALPPVSFAFVVDTSNSQSIESSEVPISRSDPPPRLRFCSLQI